MIKAILFDLDNTLLVNPTRGFVTEYLRLADVFFRKHWGEERMSDTLRHVMKALIERTSYNRTNFSIMLEAIQKTTSRSSQEIIDAWKVFFEQVYPSLQACVHPVEGAPELIQHLLESEYAIVIATNPVYPAIAIQKRLQWAGLPHQLHNYAFVSHAENTHTVKPDPAYYAELIARVGIEPDEVIVVGDDVANDMRPAEILRMHTYHVTNHASVDFAGGTLLQFYKQMRLQEWPGSMPPKSLTPSMIRPQYLGNIAALYGMLSDINPAYWHQHPDPEEWSPIEIVCHLYDSERSVQRPRLQKILNEHNPFLAVPKSPPGPGQVHCEAEGMQYAALFMRERQETLDFLSTLHPEDWHRPARHSIFGPTTLLEMAHFTAQHDRLHLNQLCRTLGKCS